MLRRPFSRLAAVQACRLASPLCRGFALWCQTTKSPSKNTPRRSELLGGDTHLIASTTPTPSPKNTSRSALLAGALIGGFSTCSISEAVGWRIIPREEAADAGEKLLRAVVRTPFQCRTIAGHFTVELSPPFPGAPVLVYVRGHSSYQLDGSGHEASARPPKHSHLDVEMVPPPPVVVVVVQL